MDFSLSSEQLAFKDTVNSFAKDKMEPYASKWDAEKVFPVNVLKEAAKLGLAAIYVPENLGGTGLGRLDAALVFEELSSACASTAAFLSIHNMTTWMVANYGSKTIHDKFLNDLITMNYISSYCLTEPGSGSDAASLSTRAEKKGDYYILNGTKSFISGASVSDVYLTMVRTGGEAFKGISCLLIEENSDGLSFGKLEKKMGWNSQPTAQVFFENCKVPVENLVGHEGEGFKIAMQGLDGGRINIGACSIGAARSCLERSLAYVNERKQFGKKISDFQTMKQIFLAHQTSIHGLKQRKSLSIHFAFQSKDMDFRYWGSHFNFLCREVRSYFSGPACTSTAGLRNSPLTRNFTTRI